jgi:soluble lytic murein transglycosylase-like protein
MLAGVASRAKPSARQIPRQMAPGSADNAAAPHVIMVMGNLRRRLPVAGRGAAWRGGRRMTALVRSSLCGLLLTCGAAMAASDEPRPAPARTETIDQALCRMIEDAAVRSRLPVEFFTRLIWRESSFRTGARSPKGALGVAQFMPGTAAERGLGDPFDPEQAIPKSAELLAELMQSFGNLGLAAAAYNGGPTRVSNWLDGHGTLPAETRDYVIAITGRSADEWAALKARPPADSRMEPESSSCLTLVATFRRPGGDRRIFAAYGGPLEESALAPWGVQLAGNFVKERALSSYGRVRQRHAALLGEVVPMIIGTRLRSRGTRAFYRVRIPAASRAAATALCDRLRLAGGSCVVLRS